MKYNKSIFISYSRKNEAVCETLRANLEFQGLDVKIDVNDIDIGTNIKDSIAQLIDATDYTVVIVSKDSLQSIWVILEIQHRIKLGEFRSNSKLIPVYLDKSYLDNKYLASIIE